MELSPENIEDLAIAISDSAPTIKTIDGVVFQNKSHFSNMDVNHATSNSQECLLNTSIEQIRGSCSFNDILDDICEMNQTMKIEQVAENSSNSQLSFPTMADLPMGSPAFFHMPDIGMQQGDYSPDCGFSNQTDFLQPLGQWPEYLSSLPSALDNQDIPQLTPIPTPPLMSLPNGPVGQEEPPDESTISVNMNLDELQLVSSTPVVPLQLFNHFPMNFSSQISHQQFTPQSVSTPNTNQQFIQQTGKEFNLLMMKDQSFTAPKTRPRIQKPVPCFGWTRVVPRKAFVQPAEVMILRPLRTRKAASLRPSFDLSSYFDTSAITIPMIRDRPRSKNGNRRKQKLCILPGAEDVIFKVQLQPKSRENGDNIENCKFIDVNNNQDQLYPETEIPELDEIFKRKRRGPNTRRNLQPQEQEKTPTSPDSMDEEKAKNPPSVTEVIDSNSDMDSDDAPLTVVKSTKCQNCRKIFKTCRSLIIHSKRCDAMHRSVVKDKQPNCGLRRSTRQISAQSNSSKENVSEKRESEKASLEGTTVARPLTRSQTSAAKRKTAGSCEAGPAKKKC